jgi:hypothetical protein
MINGIKKAKISKRTNRKVSFKKFVESGCTDVQTFLDACRNDENLLIYTCITRKELLEVFEKLKEFKTADEVIDYLINNQPIMNSDPERFDRCVKSLISYLKGYIEYNGYKLANSNGNYEDQAAEFYLKYVKICNFYRTRWFYPETLKKPSTVEHNPMLYKEFLYLVRLSISGDRKHKAFLAVLDENSSIFKLSLDSKLEDGKGDKCLGDVVPDMNHTPEYMQSQTEVNAILNKALQIMEKYPDALKCRDKIKDFYQKQDPIGFDKKTLLLAKIFLYKAGLISPKTIAFIKSLSPTYKQRYGLSESRLEKQLEDLKNIHTGKSIKKEKTEDLGWRDLIFKKRGEL